MYAWDDPEGIAELVRRNPWATIVSAVDGSPVVSHMPVLLERTGGGPLVVVGHFGRPDEERHRVGEVDMTVIVSGPHGYVTPSWYPTGTYVPTWNYVVAHLHGRGELLDADGTWDVLVRTVERFESDRPEPWSLDASRGYAERIAPGAAGFRLRAERVVGRAKLSQDKPDGIVRAVAAALDDERDVHANPQLAETMRAHLPHVLGDA